MTDPDTMPAFIAWRFMEPLLRKSVCMLAGVDGKWAGGDWDFVPPAAKLLILEQLNAMMRIEGKAGT